MKTYTHSNKQLLQFIAQTKSTAVAENADCTAFVSLFMQCNHTQVVQVQ